MTTSELNFGAFCLMFLTTEKEGFIFNIEKKDKRVGFIAYEAGKEYGDEEEYPFERYFIQDESEDIRGFMITEISMAFNKFIL